MRQNTRARQTASLDETDADRSPTPSDRRERPRHQVDLLITLLSDYGDAVTEGRIRDLSACGARADRLPLGRGLFDWQYAPLVPGTTIIICIHDPNDGQPLRLRAEVRWRREDILGLKFISVPPEAETRLRRILESSPLTQ